jgi:hypothetical protein
MELLIAFLIVAPAFYMAATRSSYLLDYMFFVVALNRGIRRLVDYYINGAFNPFSLISLTQLIIGLLIMLPALSRMNRLTAPVRNLSYLIMVAIAHGTAIGVLNAGIGAFYALGEWLAGFGAFLFVATAPVTAGTMDRWMKSSGYAALLVALYGWYQYLTIPPWDAFWVTAVNFVGYLGVLKPMEMSVFSTMHERGPCAGFLGWAAIPMILHPRWRIIGGWLTVALLLSVMLLTMVRTMFIILALIAVLQPVLSKGMGMGRVVLLAALLGIGGTVGLGYIPGSERINQRFETVKDIQNDGSFQGRLAIFTTGVPWVLGHPLGLGLGSSGFGAGRIGGGAVEGFCDSGYIEVFSQFGWIGGLAFFAALAKIWGELTRRIQQGGTDVFLFTGRAVLLGCLVFLYVGNIFGGFSLFWVFLGISLNRLTMPVVRPRYEAAPAEPSMQWDAPPTSAFTRTP